MVEPKSCHTTVPHFNTDVGGKNHRSLEDSSPKGGDIPEKSTVQIIRPSLYNNYEVQEPPTEYVYHGKVATTISIGGQD